MILFRLILEEQCTQGMECGGSGLLYLLLYLLLYCVMYYATVSSPFGCLVFGARTVS